MTNLTITIETATRRIVRLQLSDKIIIAESGYRTVSREVANWLYLALTGHAYNQPPEIARFSRAFAARAIIQSRQWINPAWRLAQEVIEQWGEHLQPWLGCLMMRPNGQIVQNAPEYTSCFSLITGKQVHSGGYYLYVRKR